ncbi:hypothetical protein ACEU07_12920 [Chromobacterium violaceum]|uniref:hypothetical protein n=1 Tax=Chromobacterium violaceum TaxID=536 RepID=UPI0035A729BD
MLLQHKKCSQNGNKFDIASQLVNNVPKMGTLVLLMKLLGRGRLQALQELGSETDTWLTSWTAEVTNANWKVANDVLSQFPSAIQKGRDEFLFPIRGQNLGVATLLVFPQKIALITSLRELS